VFLQGINDYSLLPGEIDLSPDATGAVNTGASLPPIVNQGVDVFSRIYQLITTGKNTSGQVLTPTQKAKTDTMQFLVIGGFLLVAILGVRYVFKS
jgi:hypothetical protein